VARCEQGYLCSVCGEDVQAITESELYLTYVLGEAVGGLLNRLPERHIRCNPTLAQFIVTESFPPVVASGPFCKAYLDAEFVSDEERRITSGYLRLVELAQTKVSIEEYPLAAVDVGGVGDVRDSQP
jgi:hypothetical protein